MERHMRLTPGRRLSPRKNQGLVAALKKARTLTILAEWGEVSVAAASRWEQIPEKRVSAIAKRSRIPKHVLRPDIYGRAQ
jgi:hypothetical protein